ncbi:hypothetical protein [Anaerotignum sp.]|uniref:hypothetical protein n=1 Tax=Anaerotignum sp. TaxID=2039241 RepID=UPI0027151CFD|nr:hypothetical protein [Anaerotignum sp.]
MRSVFEIKQNPSGSYYFTFRSTDEKAHIISCSFPHRAQLEACIAKVRETAPVADIRIVSSEKTPYFFIQLIEEGISFSLIGFSGERIFSSVFYSDKLLCKEAIYALKASAERAAIIDLTYE